MLKIVPIKAYTDNYIWCVIKNEAFCAVIDPGDPIVVKRFLADKPYKLKAIYLTHHHYDHVDGVQSLYDEYSPEIYGPQSTHDKVGDIVKVVTNGSLDSDIFDDIQVLSTPGHTSDHISYLINNVHLFCGDVLFSAGCGRIFDGTIEDMYSTFKAISALNENIYAYPAHEYTLANLEFAKAVEPANPLIGQAIIDVKSKLSISGCSLPTQIKAEKNFNPFLRAVIETGVFESSMIQTTDAFKSFTQLRLLKDKF